MPTYDYRCDACGHTFDEMQSFSEEPLKKCPQCKKNKLQRLFGTGAGVIFKGSGFYQTDYRSDSYKQSAKAEQDAKTGSAGKTDSTPAAPAAATNGSAGSDKSSVGETKSSSGKKSPKSSA
jgi:putative FmdB family regulatory protein